MFIRSCSKLKNLHQTQEVWISCIFHHLPWLHYWKRQGEGPSWQNQSSGWMTHTHFSQMPTVVPGVHKLLPQVHSGLQVGDLSSLFQLTSPAIPLNWTPEANAAFPELKSQFSTAPILVQPDPSQYLIVEVDTSNSGVRVVLSQWSEPVQKLHPCAFFSRCRTAAEHNYDVGNQE